MNIEREYELESVYQSIKFVALGNDRYSDRIVSVPAFRLLCSSLCLFFFVRFRGAREIEIIFVIDDFIVTRIDFFCWICILSMKISRDYWFLFFNGFYWYWYWIIESNSILHYHWISYMDSRIFQLFSNFLTRWMILKLIVLYFSILLFVSFLLIRCLEKVINLSNEISGENYSSKSDPHFFFCRVNLKAKATHLMREIKYVRTSPCPWSII